MKFKHLLCLMAILLFAANVSAQVRVRDFPDSLRVELPHLNAIVTFEMKEMFRYKNVVAHFPDSLGTLLPLIRKGLPDDLSNVGPQKIDIRYVRNHYFRFLNKERNNGKPMDYHLEVTMHKPTPEVTTLNIAAGQVTEVLPPAWTLKFFNEYYTITVYAEDFASLEAITKENFVDVMTKVETDPAQPYLGRKSIASRVISKNGQISYSNIEYNAGGDYLGIHPHAGVGVVNGMLYPEIGGSLALYFSNRFGAQRVRIDLSMETKFLVSSHDNGFSSGRATFLSLGYSRNFQKSNSRPRWTGVGVGWLAHQHKGNNMETNYFAKNTLKVYMVTDIGSGKLNLIPEFYLPGNGGFDLGLKLTYKF